jgi:hypothetical protein
MRSLDYEQRPNFAPWRNEIQLVGGIGGFGPMIDTTIESVTRSVVTTALPLESRTIVLYASPSSPFFPTDRPFRKAVLDRYQQGSRFWVYAGHGWVDSLDRVPATREGIPVLDNISVSQLAGSKKQFPIGLLLACYTGAFDASDASLAERMLDAPHGPIAVIAGTRMTMPYGNTSLAVNLIDHIYANSATRLGDAWLAAQRAMRRDDTSTPGSLRFMIDTLAIVVSPPGTVLVDERREHCRLYNLLGDPTLKLHPPQSIAMAGPTGVSPGSSLPIEITSPIAGQLQITLDRPLGAINSGDGNNTRLHTSQITVTPNQPLLQELPIANDWQGPIIVRAVVSGEQTWATGALRVLVR